MKFLIIIPLFLLLNIDKIQSQDTIRKKILVGIETGAAGLNARDRDTGKKYKAYSLRLAPYVGVFFFKNRVNVGITGEYSFYKSNFDKKPRTYGLGAFVRYYLPIIDYLPRKLKKNEYIRSRFLFYGEFSYNRVNYYQGKNGVVAFNSLQETVLRFSLGIHFRLWKQLHIDSSIRPQIYLGKNRYPISRRAGHEYHF